MTDIVIKDENNKKEEIKEIKSSDVGKEEKKKDETVKSIEPIKTEVKDIVPVALEESRRRDATHPTDKLEEVIIPTEMKPKEDVKEASKPVKKKRVLSEKQKEALKRGRETVNRKRKEAKEKKQKEKEEKRKEYLYHKDKVVKEKAKTRYQLEKATRKTKREVKKKNPDDIMKDLYLLARKKMGINEEEYQRDEEERKKREKILREQQEEMKKQEELLKKKQELLKAYQTVEPVKTLKPFTREFIQKSQHKIIGKRSDIHLSMAERMAMFKQQQQQKK